MTNALHVPARPATPIACDMRTAQDTPDERLSEYGRLFDAALIRRERTADAVVFVFRADPVTRNHVEDLARREAACCPFLDYRVETVDDELVYTITGDGRASVDVGLDAIYALPEYAGSDFAGLLDRLADGGFHVIQPTAGSERFELRD